MIGVTAGTFSVSAVMAEPALLGSGTVAVVAILLLLVGALTKSAQVPFHFWLPGAMAAPTPVSAYLHAAAMVKAGVYLVALLAPVFADLPGWRPVVLTLGAMTMIIGAWRALRQYDIKLLLAYGTVSQLGFLMAMCGLGTRSAMMAGVAMIISHALFKAALFLVVGIVDRSTGTRDIRKLSGVAKRLPLVAGAAAVAAASMAAVPPLIGFTAKEAAFESLLYLLPDGDGTGIPPLPAFLLTAALVAGSALTVAYTLRFLWGAFGTKPGVLPTEVTREPFGFALAPVDPGRGLPGRRLRRPGADPGAGTAGRHRRGGRTQPRHRPVARSDRAAGPVGAGPVRRCADVRPPSLDRPGAGHLPADPGGRGGLPVADAGDRPLRRRGHRRHPARVAADLPRHHHARAGRAARVGAADAAVLAELAASLGRARAGAGRGDDDRRRRARGQLAGSAQGGHPGRGHRLRHGPDVPAARRPGSRAHPDPGGDGHPGGVRAGAAQAAQVLHRPPAALLPLVAAGDRGHGRLHRGVDGLPGGSGPGGHAGVGGVLRGGVHVRVRQEHRQRHPGRHPLLGHPGRDLGAGGRRHRGRQPDLHPAPLHRARAAPRCRPTAPPQLPPTGDASRRTAAPRAG